MWFAFRLFFHLSHIFQMRKLGVIEINLLKITLPWHQDSFTFNFKIHGSFQSLEHLEHKYRHR